MRHCHCFMSSLSFMRLLLGFAAIFLLCGSGLLIVVAAAEENDTGATTADVATGAATGWMEGCRREGFDPGQLACVTCDLMPSEETKATCLTCCQSYKNVVLTGGGRFDKPHQAAILVLPKGLPVPEEVQKLLNDNWLELVETKGADRLLQLELNPLVTTSSTANMRFLFASPPTYIYFFDDKSIASYRTATSAAMIADAAKESISLQGWKREDIKDMLQTMLP